MDTKNSTATPAHPSTEEENRPHACLDGWVYLGHLVEDEDGNEVEAVEGVRCRRCAADAR